MRARLHDFTSRAEDLLGAGYRGLSAARVSYRERRRRRSEAPAFSAAFARASFIGGWLAREEAELLYELAAAVPEGRDIVEVGSYLGRSTAFLAQGAGAGRTVHAVDPHTSGSLQLRAGPGLDTFPQFQRNMAAIDVADRVEPHVTVSAQAAAEYGGRPVGLLFVDGNHSERAVVEDGQAWAPHLADGCFVAFDDFAWSGVRAGLARLVADGVVPALAGRVGKIGICGPAAAWPARVRAIAMPVEGSWPAARRVLRRMATMPRAAGAGNAPRQPASS
jgi:predicted O-methyltransferase YrrM